METETKLLPRRVSHLFTKRYRAWSALAPAALLCACGANDPAGGKERLDESSAALAVSAACDDIIAQLQSARELVAELQAEYLEARGAAKIRILRQLNAARALVRELEADLDRCQNPPPPLPDLVAANFLIAPHADGTAVDAALLVRNDGQGAAQGPFNIVFGSDSGTIFRQLTFRVPSAVTIAPGTSYISEYMRNIVLVRDANGVANYRLDAIVDSDAEVSESNEGNNMLTSFVADPPQGPPPPPQCPTGWSCCEPIPGGCNQCIPPGASCP